MGLMKSLRKNLLDEPLQKALATETRKLLKELKKADTKETPRVFDYGVNFNQFHTQIKRPATSGVSFDTLRQFSIFYPIARACINHLKTQVSKLEWDIAPIEVDKTKPKVKQPKEKEMVEFFKNIGGKSKSFRALTSEIVEDATVLDAVALFKERTFGGELIKFVPVDAATIRLMINEDGTTPEPPEFAYQQIIGGKVLAEMTTEEMIYARQQSRTNSPYGLSALESLITTVSTALKAGSYNLAYLAEGNVPEGFMELPPEIGSNVEKMKEWQNYFDALLSGNPTYQTRLKTVPAGTKYTPTKKPEDMSFERFEKWLLQNTCAVFGVPPQAIGFTYEVNKATGETQKSIGEEKGTLVLSNFLKEIFDKIIQEDLGETDYQFVWTNLNPVDEAHEIEIIDRKVRAGITSIDEVRLEQGLEPIGMDNAFFGSGGPVLLRNFEKRQEEERERMEATMEQKPQEAKEEPEEDTEEENDIRRWRKVAKKALLAGKPVKKFESDHIHPALYQKINDELSFATSVEHLDRVFDRYIGRAAETALYRGAIKFNALLNQHNLES